MSMESQVFRPHYIQLPRLRERASRSSQGIKEEKYSGDLEFARMGKVGKAEAIFNRELPQAIAFPLATLSFVAPFSFSSPSPPPAPPEPLFLFLRRFSGYVIDGEIVSTVKARRRTERARKLYILYCIV